MPLIPPLAVEPVQGQIDPPLLAALVAQLGQGNHKRGSST
jgi:hypothetical protein